MTGPNWNRRRVLQGITASAALLPMGAGALAAPVAARVATLELTNLHTGECVTVEGGQERWEEPALQALCGVLRDHRSGEAHPIDTGLYEQLLGLAALARVDARFEIISGYRSPATNAKLHERSSGVAKKSLHMEGRALDIRLRGVGCKRLAELAVSRAQGGVGYYAKSAFVHIDTGRVRYWEG